MRNRAGTGGVVTDAWGKFPQWPLKSGVFAGLPSAAWRVYAVLVAHSDGESSLAHPGVALIAAQTKLHEKSVGRALRVLKRAGMIRLRSQGGGAGHAAEWEVIRSAGATKEGSAGAANSAASGAPARGEGNAADPKGERPASRQQRRSRAATEAAGTAAAGVAAQRDETIEVLVAAGIGEPTRSRLAAAEGVDARLVERVVSARREGEGTGLIVRRIEEGAQKATTDRKGRARHLRADAGPSDALQTASDDDLVIARDRLASDYPEANADQIRRLTSGEIREGVSRESRRWRNEIADMLGASDDGQI